MVGESLELDQAKAMIAARRAAEAAAESSVPPVPRPSRVWPDEKPAAQWLSEEARTAFADRLAWLEAEARALPDKVARARGRLSCSEIAATIGEREAAHALATEARTLAPSIAMAHRQARATLAPGPADAAEVIEALDLEVKLTPAGPARVHSALLAADLLQATGHGDGAAKRLEQAARTRPRPTSAPRWRGRRARSVGAS